MEKDNLIEESESLGAGCQTYRWVAWATTWELRRLNGQRKEGY
jgi:hypothetical protein